MARFLQPDVAFRELYPDRVLSQVKLDTAQGIQRSMEKAKPAGDSPGITKLPKEEFNEAEDGLEVDKFVQEMQFLNQRGKPVRA